MLFVLLCMSCTPLVHSVPDPNFSATLDQYIATHPARRADLLAALENPSRWINLSYKELLLVANSNRYTPQRFWGDGFYIDYRHADQCRSLDGVMFFQSYVIVIRSCRVVASLITTPHIVRIQQFLLTDPDVTFASAQAFLEQRVVDGMTMKELRLLYPSVRFQETRHCYGSELNHCTEACKICDVTLLFNGVYYFFKNRSPFGVPRLTQVIPPLPLSPN
ncbi:MAG: hypothetical protein HY273_01535 [Gammaproteobacteria bacterium]|nr:hypothetical protein [Gammaproteobacteria bacterium]